MDKTIKLWQPTPDEAEMLMLDIQHERYMELKYEQKSERYYDE